MVREWMQRCGAVVAALGLAGAVASGPVVAEPATSGGVDRTAIDRYVTAYAARAGYPGVAIAITRGDRVLYSAGYGQDSAGRPVTAATPMPIASVSKSFTALAVMRLVETGRVELDAPVRRYVPGFRIADPRGARITVRHLLQQTSGISDGTLAEKSLPQPHSPAEAVVRARTATLAAEPGTRHFYTNTNYHLAARVVELTSGEPFDAYLRRHVLGPAGMRTTGTVALTPRDLPATVTDGHIYAYGATVPAPEPLRYVTGSDGLVSTAEDMARWLVVQSTGGRSADGTRLVSPASVRAMHTSSDPRWTYGMGWDTYGGKVRHGGIWFTYAAGVELTKSGYGVAVLSNSGVSIGNEGTAALEDGIAAVLDGRQPPAPPSTRLTIDLMLAGLTLLSIALGVRALRRNPIVARRNAVRPVWVVALRSLPRLVPPAVLIAMPNMAGVLYPGGRDVTYGQMLYFVPALVIWFGASSAANLAIALTRLRARLRRAPEDATVPVASAFGS